MADLFDDIGKAISGRDGVDLRGLTPEQINVISGRGSQNATLANNVINAILQQRNRAGAAKESIRRFGITEQRLSNTQKNLQTERENIADRFEAGQITGENRAFENNLAKNRTANRLEEIARVSALKSANAEADSQVLRETIAALNPAQRTQAIINPGGFGRPAPSTTATDSLADRRRREITDRRLSFFGGSVGQNKITATTGPILAEELNTIDKSGILYYYDSKGFFESNRGISIDPSTLKGSPTKAEILELAKQSGDPIQDIVDDLR